MQERWIQVVSIDNVDLLSSHQSGELKQHHRQICGENEQTQRRAIPNDRGHWTIEGPRSRRLRAFPQPDTRHGQGIDEGDTYTVLFESSRQISNDRLHAADRTVV